MITYERNQFLHIKSARDPDGDGDGDGDGDEDEDDIGIKLKNRRQSSKDAMTLDVH